MYSAQPVLCPGIISGGNGSMDAAVNDRLAARDKVSLACSALVLEDSSDIEL